MPLIAPDLLRLAALVSVVAGTVAYGWLGFALFFLVLGGVFVPRALGTAPWLDAAYCAALLFGAWAAQLDWYAEVPGLDLAVHAVATGLIGVLCWQLLVRVGALPRPDERLLARPRLGAVVVTASVATGLAGVWEIGEWAGHTFLDDRIQVGYADTVGDLAAGLLGAVVAALLAVAATRPLTRDPVREPGASPTTAARR